MSTTARRTVELAEDEAELIYGMLTQRVYLRLDDPEHELAVTARNRIYPATRSASEAALACDELGIDAAVVGRELLYEVECGIHGTYRVTRRKYATTEGAMEAATRWAASNSTGDYWAEVTDHSPEGGSRVIARINLDR